MNYYCVEVCTTTGQNIIDTFSFILSFLDDLLMLKFHSLQMLTFCTFSIFKLIVFRVLHFYITRLRQIEVCNKRKRNFLLFIAKLFIVSRLYINSHQITTFNWKRMQTNIKIISCLNLIFTADHNSAKRNLKLKECNSHFSLNYYYYKIIKHLDKTILQ